MSKSLFASFSSEREESSFLKERSKELLLILFAGADGGKSRRP
jgi:hypothetical protein